MQLRAEVPSRGLQRPRPQAHPRTFPTLAAAKSWQRAAGREVALGLLQAPGDITLTIATEAFLSGIKDASIRNRSGDIYKPGVIRGYEQALRSHLLPHIGTHKLAKRAAPTCKPSWNACRPRAGPRRRSVTRSCRYG